MDQLWYGDMSEDDYIDRYLALYAGAGGPGNREVDEAFRRMHEEQA